MLEVNKPTLQFINEADQAEISMVFGYYRDDPYVQVGHEDLLILIPRAILEIALEQGWDEGEDRQWS